MIVVIICPLKPYGNNRRRICVFKATQHEQLLYECVTTYIVLMITSSLQTWVIALLQTVIRQIDMFSKQQTIKRELDNSALFKGVVF